MQKDVTGLAFSLSMEISSPQPTFSSGIPAGLVFYCLSQFFSALLCISTQFGLFGFNLIGGKEDGGCLGDLSVSICFPKDSC
jgi:hypothetical protein